MKSGKYAGLYLDQKDASMIQRDLDKKAQVPVWKERDHLLHCDWLCSEEVQRHSQISLASLEEMCYGRALLSTWFVDSRFSPPVRQ